MNDVVEVVCGRCGAVNRYPVDASGRTESCEQCSAYIDVPSALEDSDALELGDDSTGDLDGSTVSDAAPEGAAIVLLCPFCDEHAEFDAASAGTTQPCPHCGEELDVLGSLVEEAATDATVYFRCDWCKRIACTDGSGLTHGCECPNCGEANDAEAVIRNRLTSGQVERLGLRPGTEE